MANSKPLRNVLLYIEKAFQDEIVTQSGIKFYLDGSYEKNWNASVTAIIAELPTNPLPQHKKILSQLNAGDEVAISYQVVFDLAFGSDGKRFMLATEGNDYWREYYSGAGERLSIYALPKRWGFTDTPMWVGIYQNKNKEVISGKQGTQAQVERWLSQFPIGKTDEYTFNNLFSHQNKDYWNCSPQYILIPDWVTISSFGFGMPAPSMSNIMQPNLSILMPI